MAEQEKTPARVGKMVQQATVIFAGAEISDLVKQVAIAMAKKLGGGNFFGTVFGQLYRTFNVTSYKLLTQAQYPKAVEWLQKQIKTYES
jgi:hypothetical protein